MRFVSLTAAMFLTCLPLLGGLTTGDLRGKVEDETGAAAGGISVALKCDNGLRLESRTAARGYFDFLGLEPGICHLEFQSDGQGPSRPETVEILPGNVIRVRVRLSRPLAGGVTGVRIDSSILDAGQSKTPGAGRLAPATLQSLPLSFSIWDLIQKIEPTAVVFPVDFGGLTDNRLPLVSLGAQSWTHTGYEWDGASAGDPYQPGRALFLPDVSAVEMAVAWTSSGDLNPGSNWPAAAVYTRAAGTTWHARASSFGTASALASSNLPDTAASGGLLRPEAFSWLTRDHLDVGGPIGPRFGIFASGTGQWASQQGSRDPANALLHSKLLFGAFDGRYRPHEGDRIHFSFNGSRINLSGFGEPAGLEDLFASPGYPPFQPSPGQPETDHLDLLQASWAHTPQDGRQPAFQVRYTYHTAHLDTGLPNTGAALPNLPVNYESRLNLLTGSIQGPAPLGNLALRTRQSFSGTSEMGTFDTGFLRHEIQMEAGWSTAGVRNRLAAPLDMSLIEAGGLPSTIIELNTPLDSRSRVRSGSLSADDSIRVGNRLLIRAQLTADLARGSLPAQSSPGGVFTDAHRFAAVNDVIVWNHAEPAASIALALLKRYGLVVRGGYARRYEPLASRYLDFANPNSLSGAAYQWLDLNRDGFWEPGETGPPLRRFGGQYSSIDSALRRPYSDQLIVSLEARLPASIHAEMSLFRTDDKRRLAAENTGVPFEPGNGTPSYSPVTILDPGPDFIAATFDDQLLTVYNQNPSTLGKDRFLLSNPGIRSLAEGLVAMLSGGGKGLWWRLSFVAEKESGANNPGNSVIENDPGVVGTLYSDPNSLLFANGRSSFDRAYIAKFQGAYQLPRWAGKMELGTVVNYYDGLPFARELLITGLAQGPFVIATTPRGNRGNGNRTTFSLTMDARVSRQFELPVGTLRAIADGFNLPNLDNNTQDQAASGPDFNRRLPFAIEAPRFFRLGLEFAF